jgi:putative mRNA 3-end processing factor
VLELGPNGLYCSIGDFWIDPWGPVDRAVITHAHSDHARPGARQYLTVQSGAAILRERIGPEPGIQAVAYGESLTLGGALVSLHPAGHILGSAQVRIESGGEVWVVSGDYKVTADPTCTAFEPIRCHTFVTESTFGLPIFRWPEADDVARAIENWWRGNQASGKASVLFAYPLGKAQRLLASLDSTIGPVYTHGAVEKVNALYRAQSIALPATVPVWSAAAKTDWSQALVVAPPMSSGSPWMRRFGAASTAFASGWMRVRGTRRRRSLDRGFVISDHADWPGLLGAIEATGAERVWVTHGYRAPLARWLAEHGREAVAVETQYEGELAETAAEEEAEP